MIGVGSGSSTFKCYKNNKYIGSVFKKKVHEKLYIQFRLRQGDLVKVFLDQDRMEYYKVISHNKYDTWMIKSDNIYPYLIIKDNNNNHD